MVKKQGQMGVTSRIQIYEEPKLNDPYLVAAWPGMGNVALKTATYLKEKLQTKDLGIIYSSDFFETSEIFIRNSLVEPIQFPENKFYYIKDEKRSNDILFFIGDSQPLSGKEYEFANMVLDVAEKFNVRRVFTFAAFATNIHYLETRKVWGVATHRELLKGLQKQNVLLMNDGPIGGMNGLVLGVAKKRGMKGVCLLGEMQYYAVQIENTGSSEAILKVLTRMLGVKINMTELEALSRYTEGEIAKLFFKIEELKLDQMLGKGEDSGSGYLH